MASNTISTFIDFTTLPAQAGTKYGIVDNTHFLASAVFNIAADSIAYAVQDGTVLIQPQLGTDKVNLVLRPNNVKFGNIPNVKYFIYRGLRLDNFIVGTSLAAETSSDFLHTIWTDYQTANGSSGMPSPKRVGYDLFFVTDNYDLDRAFAEIREDVDNNNLPLVLATIKQGQTLGRFKAGKICFEIVLEDQNSILSLGELRTEEHLITVDTPSAATYGNLSIDERSAREKILAFVDPAAYFGLYGADGMEIVNNANNQTISGWGDIYSFILDKFLTKRTIYVDVRNEYGYSLDYGKDNEGNGTHVDSGNHFKIGVNTAPAPALYYQDLWPLYSIDNIGTTGNAPITISLCFWRTYNPVPVIYIDCLPLSSNNLLAGSEQRFWVDNTYDTYLNRYAYGVTVVTEHWSNVFDCAVPGNNGHSYACCIKLYNNRRYVPQNVPSSAFKRDHYLDNVFGPVLNMDRILKINTTQLTQWHTGLGRRYINIRANGMDDHSYSFEKVLEYIVDIGVAVSNDRVLFYANVVSYNLLYSAVQIIKPFDLFGNSQSSGASSSNAIYEMRNPELPFMGKIDTVNTFTYDVTTPSIPSPFPVIFKEEGTLGQNLIEFSVLFSRDEYTNSLYSVAETFNSNLHNVFLNFDGLEEVLADGTLGKPDIFIKECLIKLSGYDNLGNYQVKNPVGGGILHVVSRDGFKYTSINSQANSLGYFAIEQRPNALIDLDDFIEYILKIEQRFIQWDEDNNYPGITSSQKTATRVRVHSYGRAAKTPNDIKGTDIMKEGLKKEALENAVPGAAYVAEYQSSISVEAGKVVRNLDQDSKVYISEWDDIYKNLTAKADENMIRDNPSPYIRVAEPNDPSRVESVDMGQIFYGFESLVTPSIANRSTFNGYNEIGIFDPFDLTAIIANIATPIANIFTANFDVPGRSIYGLDQKELEPTDPDIYLRLDRYYQISAPDADLFGNADAIGLRYAFQKLNVANPKLSQVMKLYYKQDSSDLPLNADPAYYTVNNRWLIFCLFMNLAQVSGSTIQWQPGKAGSVWETGTASDPLSFNKASLKAKMRVFTLFWMNKTINPLVIGPIITANINLNAVNPFTDLIADFDDTVSAYPGGKTERAFYIDAQDYLIDKFLTYIKGKLVAEQGNVI